MVGWLSVGSRLKGSDFCRLKNVMRNGNEVATMAEGKERSQSGFLVDLDNSATTESNILQRLNDILKKAGVDGILPHSANSHVGSLIRSGHLPPEFDEVLGQYLQHSVVLTARLKKYTTDYNEEWSIKKRKDDEVREAERAAMWILWLQRLVRWSAGIVFAVVLYSALVWASENFKFVKIPIRDLFPHGPTELAE